MLDAYIIEAILEEERARERARDNAGTIQLEVPSLEYGGPSPSRDSEPDWGADRGIVVIPLYPPEPDAEDAA